MLTCITDSVFFASTVATCLMCLSASLVGVMIHLQKKSLIGEALSHSTYPGIVLGAFLLEPFVQEPFFWIIPCAGAAAYLSIWTIDFFIRRKKTSQDTALCFILASFFSIGLCLASRLQSVNAKSYKQIQIYLFGQVATMVNKHILFYALLSVGVILFVTSNYSRIQLWLFDRTYAKSQGVPIRFLDCMMSLLLVLCITMGMRSVGIILMTGMFLAPVITARFFTHRLKWLLVISGVIGMSAGFLGNILSIICADFVSLSMSLPTGPMIVLTGCFFVICAFLFSPRKGLVFQWLRMMRFTISCVNENILKTMYKSSPCSFSSLKQMYQISSLKLLYVLRRLKKQGWISQRSHLYELQPKGEKKAKNIIRYHRLWEVYLYRYRGIGSEKVHKNAEEIEHIITPEIEEQLTSLLNDPLMDPHQKEIPKRSV
jgi:manganese/zinc/iron transport system permease protein